MPTPNQPPPLRPVAQASRWLPGKTVQRFAKTRREASGRGGWGGGGGSLQGSLRLACHCFWRPPSLRLALLGRGAFDSPHRPSFPTSARQSRTPAGRPLATDRISGFCFPFDVVAGHVCQHSRRVHPCLAYDEKQAARRHPEQPIFMRISAGPLPDDLAVTATAGIPVTFDILCPAHPEPCPAALTITTQTRYEIPASTSNNPVCQC